MSRFTKRAGTAFVKFILIATGLLVETSALADAIPESCTGTYELQIYNAGVLSGENIVTMGWKVINDCQQIETFDNIVMDLVRRFQLPVNASTITMCRYSGYVNGVMAAVSDIYQNCEGLCYNEGAILGRLAGTIYCDLSIALGGLAKPDDFIVAPVNTCGPSFTFACKESYKNTTDNYTPTGSCTPYTKDPYTEVWTQFRDIECP